MKKLPVAGPTYDYKLENIRNDIIEQELALCLKRQEDLATNSTIVDGDGNTTTLRANLDTEFYTRTEADTAIASATTSLVSETALNTALGDYTNTATLEQNFYTKTDADSAIASATLNLVSTSDLTNELGNYTTTASLEQNYYTETEANNAISSAITTNNISLGNTYATIDTVSSVSGDVDGIQGKYAVKIDNNGHVSGFGLISTANNAAISGDGISGAATTSTFTIAADAFKIVDTSGAATPAAPFEVYTTSRTVDGVTVPAGVYMENANITAANIKTLDVDVINLDGVTLDTSGGQLIVKDGGVDTVKLASDAVSSQSKTFVSSFTLSGGPVFGGQTIASLNVSGTVGDKFLCIGTVNYFGLPVADDGDFFTGYIFLNNVSTVYLDRIGNGYDSTQKGGFSLVGVNTLNTTGSSIPLDFRISQFGLNNHTANVYSIHLQAIKLER